MEDDSLMHYGTPRHSGRYPWGSGDNPYQRNASFMSYVKDLEKSGMKETEIAKGMGMTTKELRARKSIARTENRMADSAEAWRLKEKGYSNVAIAKRMGLANESTVRSLLDPHSQARTEMTMATANMLKDQLKEKIYLDIGVGVENYLGCSRTKLGTSVEMLKAEGYEVHNIPVEQLGTSKLTTVQVLCPPGTTWKDVIQNKDKIGSISEYTNDGGKTWYGIEKPKSISSDRIQVRYAEEGGTDKDGVIELRRGVADIALGDSSYAQVRIAVDDTHYLKGMAIYNDNMPKGKDIIFNTNKKKGTPLTSKDPDAKQVLKPMKDDPDNPFGAEIKRQVKYKDKDGKEHLSAINIVNEEGDWAGWKKSLSSQVLSKQDPKLAKKQLALAYDDKKAQYDEIMSLTNPVIKKKLLQSFADNCDSSATHLEAAAMPRQASHVILPLTSLKDNEIYAPRYNDGETVALIRYPHGGKFEIPILKVNNRNKEGRSVVTSKSVDAVGINSKVAERLSGADFDGDTVLVIPNNKTGPLSINAKPSLPGLKNFDPKEAYPGYPGMKKMTKQDKGKKMGEVSNLITDMTIKGATDAELTRAVKHSMVVIDAEKHELNYKQSYIDHGIAELSKRYQGKARGGASTLISRAKSPAVVEKRGRELVDPETGKKYYKKLSPEKITYVDKKTGKTVTRVTKSTKMAETDDAFTLSSGQPIETVYARHANQLKDLANKARKEAVNAPNLVMSTSAKKTYAKEVESLKGKLNIAEMNRPRERQAQLLAGQVVKAKKESNPDLDSEDLKKIKNQALDEARRRVGASKKDVQVEITDREWEAIQSGAVSTGMLNKILSNTDEDRIKQLATPKERVTMSPARIARAKRMINAGCTQAEVAKILGVSVSTVSRALNE